MITEKVNRTLVIRSVAIATDFAPWSHRAMQFALAIARGYGAALDIVHSVRRTEFSFVPDLIVPLDELAERDSEELMSRLHATHNLDGVEYRSWNLDGEVSTIGDFVRDQNIDLLILGTRGRSGLSKLVLGSIAEQIFHCVPCPVLTVGPRSRAAGSRPALKNVLFATDLSVQSVAAFPYALAAAEMWSADIHVLHACSADHSINESRMDAYRLRLDAHVSTEARIPIRHEAVPGAPASVVLEFANRSNADLIVLGLDTHRSLYGWPATLTCL